MTSLNSDFKPLSVVINNRKVDRFDSLEAAQAAAQKRNGSEAIVARHDETTGETFFILADVKQYEQAPMNPTDPVVAFSFDPDPKSYNQSKTETFQYHSLELLDNDLKAMQSFFRTFDVQDPDPFSQLPTQPTGLQRQRFDVAAQLMGFKDFKQMQYQFRNLAPEKIQAMLQQVTIGLQTAKAGDADGRFTSEEMQKAASRTFAAEIKTEINQMFVQEKFPPPLFSGDAEWNGTAVMAVFNGLSEVKARSPSHFKLLATAPGKDLQGKDKPFEFKRAPSPELQGGDLISNLNTSMRIAHTCTTGCLTLHDAAVSAKTSDVLRDQIASQLSLIMRRDTVNPAAINPTYTSDELKARGLEDKRTSQGSVASKETHEGVFKQITTAHFEKFGGNDRLLYAYNFVVKFRGLDVSRAEAETRKANGENIDPAVFRNEPLAFLVPPMDDSKKDQIFKALGTMNVKQMREVAFMMEQMQATSSLQSFLKDTTPAGKSLTGFVDSGFYGQQTTLVVKQFQLNLVLNMYKERIEDDKSLPEGVKREFIAYFDNQFEKLGKVTGANDNDYSLKLEETMRGILKNINTVMRFLHDPTQNTLSPNKFSEISSDTRTALKNQNVKISSITAEALQRDMKIAVSMIDGKFSTKTAQHLVQSWFDVMDTGGGGVDMAEQLVVHELGHVLQPQLGKQENLQVEENWKRIGLLRAEETDGFSMKKATGSDADGSSALRNDRSSVSDYGSTTTEEDFAECYRVYTYDPDRLMRRSLMKYMFIHALNQPSPLSREQAAEISSKIMQKARDAGYTNDDIRATLSRVLGHGDQSIQFTPEMRSKLQEVYGPLLVIKTLESFLLGAADGVKQAVGTFASSLTISDPPPLHKTYSGVVSQYEQFNRSEGVLSQYEQFNQAEIDVDLFPKTWEQIKSWDKPKVNTNIAESPTSALALYGNIAKFEERFLNNGTASLPDMTTDELTAYNEMVRQLESLGLKKSQINAMILAQGKLRAAGESIPFDKLQGFFGEKIWSQLPDAFKTKLENPRTMDAIAKSGAVDASLHAFSEIMQDVGKRQQSSGGAYLAQSINDLFVVYLGADVGSVDGIDFESFYGDLKDTVDNHNKGSQIKATLPPFNRFKAELQTFYHENQHVLHKEKDPQQGESQFLKLFQGFMKNLLVPNFWSQTKLNSSSAN